MRVSDNEREREKERESEIDRGFVATHEGE